jgi:hypothetical protein
VNISWADARRFTPNPAVSDFEPKQCQQGGTWIKRNSTFFVGNLLEERGHLSNSITQTWQECAKLCEQWTVEKSSGLMPCAMWSWKDYNKTTNKSWKNNTCLLAQQFAPPAVGYAPGWFSGCLFDTVCNATLPRYQPNETASLTNRHDLAAIKQFNADADAAPTAPSSALCQEAHVMSLDFARNYTTFLVSLHDAFNGKPDALYGTLGQMYALKSMAINLMETDDPRINTSLGIGPPWEYVADASEYETRGRRAR